MHKSIFATACATLLVTASASSELPTLATVERISGETGSVWLFRAGTSEAVVVGDTLRLGDRIATRPGGHVELRFEECTAKIDQPDTLIISENSCNIIQARAEQHTSTLTEPTTQTDEARVETITANAPTGSGIGIGTVVGGVVVVGAGSGGIAVVLSGGDNENDDVPVSP